MWAFRLFFMKKLSREIALQGTWSGQEMKNAWVLMWTFSPDSTERMTPSSIRNERSGSYRAGITNSKHVPSHFQDQGEESSIGFPQKIFLLFFSQAKTNRGWGRSQHSHTWTEVILNSTWLYLESHSQQCHENPHIEVFEICPRLVCQ